MATRKPPDGRGPSKGVVGRGGPGGRGPQPAGERGSPAGRGGQGPAGSASGKGPPGKGPPGKGPPGKAPPGKGPPGKGPGRSNPNATRDDARRAALKASRVLSAKLHGATLVQKTDTKATQFDIEMPSLDKIEVEIPTPPAITDADVEAYVQDLIRFSLKKSPRLEGEPIALMDEILVDSTGYCRGVVFSAQADQWLTMRENPLLPSLFDQLVGLGVGESTVVNLRLPSSYPDPEFADSLAAFAIHVKSAMRPPDDVSRDELMRELNYGQTWDVAKEKVRAELEDSLAKELITKAKEAVLEELERRGKSEVPDAAIKAHLAETWRETDGKGMAKAGVDFDAQQTALKRFQETEENQTVARHELWRVAFLEEAARHFDVQVDRKDLKVLMGKAAEAMGLDKSLVDPALDRMESLSQKLTNEMRLARAFDVVLEKTTIRFV